MYPAGSRCFFHHPKESWVVGTVVGEAKGVYKCKADDAARKCTGDVIEKIPEAHVTNCRDDLLDEMPNDLLGLTVLHDATLVRCLFLRYMKDIIYTNIGAIVVALNPFNFKIPWYLDDKMKDYLQEGPVIEKNLPHSWAQAHNTYNEMMQDAGDQCILISGESGAGKTEATKIVLKYLAHISCATGSAEQKEQAMSVGAKLTSCSPVLEAFGNAKTVRNDNSSRFGKFMKVKFKRTGELVGAFTIKYLLEKSRVIVASKNERVYHAFYIVARGHLASKFGLLTDEKKYVSINSGQCPNNKEFNDASDFSMVVKSLNDMNINGDMNTSVWATTAGLLSLLNCKFTADGEGSKIEDPHKGVDKCIELLKLDGDVLRKELVTTTLVMVMKGKEERTTKILKPPQALDARDALVKATYEHLFAWLVDRANDLCDTESDGNWIGALDIFGFEDFEVNSFEQLCINLANETLQNHYNTFIFSKDMDECRSEGVDVTEVKCPDNSPCLKLVSDPRAGIMKLLDDECSLGKGTDIGFMEKAAQMHLGKNPFFDKKKTSKDCFIVKHYAGDVSYNVAGWLEKNRDTLKDAMKEMLRNSQDPLVAVLIPPPDGAAAAGGKSKKSLTVGGTFKDQVQQLMDVINSTNPHWIRCIKPHPAKKPLMFDGVTTMNQLDSSGVLGTVKIRKAGYPIRIVFQKFALRYLIIIGKKLESGEHSALCSEILTAVDLNKKEMAQIGKTKVFMKAEALPMMEKARVEKLQGSVKKMQAVGRGYMERVASCKAKATKVCTVFAQAMCREYRDYLRRSSAIREQKRKEKEARLKAIRDGSVELEKEWVADVEVFMKEELKAIAAAKKRADDAVEAIVKAMEATKAEREQFQRNEFLARSSLFEKELRHMKHALTLYDQEILLHLEQELGWVERHSLEEREKIEAMEKEGRKELRKTVAAINVEANLSASVDYERDSRALLSQLQFVGREEIVGRVAILRAEDRQRLAANDSVMPGLHKAQRRYVKRLKLEHKRDIELRRLLRLREAEVERSGSSLGSQARQTSSPSFDQAVKALRSSVERDLLCETREASYRSSASPTGVRTKSSLQHFADPTYAPLSSPNGAVLDSASPKRGHRVSYGGGVGPTASPTWYRSQPGDDVL